MSLIASVLHLSRADIKTLGITDPYSLHRAVYSLYDDVRSDADKAGSQASGILYADRGGDFHGRKILLLANRAPAEQARSNHGQAAGQVQSKAIADDFLSHTRYSFKVIVNPTRRDNKSRKLLPVKGRDAIAQWFMERSPASWGFAIAPAHLQINKVEVLQFKGKDQQPITLAQAHIQGQLQVTDAQQFQRSFAQGIGRGRSFGCGLLQIVPLLDSPFA